MTRSAQVYKSDVSRWYEAELRCRHLRHELKKAEEGRAALTKKLINHVRKTGRDGLLTEHGYVLAVDRRAGDPDAEVLTVELLHENR